LHPTSLPGRFGIGDLGEEAYRFVDFLANSGQQIWQVLPLGPTGFGDSPYQCFSAFAGNPLLISPEKLAEEGLLSPADLRDAPSFPAHRVDYGPVIEFKKALLRKSFEQFRGGATPTQREEVEAFCEQHRGWIYNYALFMALKDAHGGAVWNTWDPNIAARKPEAMNRWKQALSESILFHTYVQVQFFKQWSELKHYANARGIHVIGDLPIFVAHDSADVWAHPDLFFLDKQGQPTVVAGVPPDYFSATGQLWGNPLYRWDVLAQRGYDWWIERFKQAFAMVDRVRLDHFRGFEAYWEVPAMEKTAVRGRWVKGPGADLFNALKKALGALPIIAEDLGVITPEVTALREQFGFPGMKVLQFAFTGPENTYLPHHFTQNLVVYTGTHDNDTAVGWFTGSSTPEERVYALKYLGTDGSQIHWDLIRLAFASVADAAIVPLQDVLGLDTEARMNFPSRASGNWSWRYTPDGLTDEVGEKLGDLTVIYGRGGKHPEGTAEC